MKTKNQQRRDFINWYKLQTGKTLVDMHEIAAAAKKMGWEMPIPADPLDVLAKQFSEAAREEIRQDTETNQPYRGSLTFTRRKGDGRQETLWMDVDEAPRQYMVKGLNNYRDQMVGEAVMATNTANHWNRINPDQMPLNFVTDFSEDVAERLVQYPKAS